MALASPCEQPFLLAGGSLNRCTAKEGSEQRARETGQSQVVLDSTSRGAKMWVVTAKESAEPSDLRCNLSLYLGILWKVAEG